jgi:predicted molibdopterin-dependent oxidoreductase YjgC
VVARRFGEIKGGRRSDALTFITSSKCPMRERTNAKRLAR